MGSRLTIPTYLIQLISSMDATSIEQIGDITFNAVREVFAKQKQFYIIGHSFGAIVAIQLAQMLERTGMNGRVLLMDGSPVYLKRMSEAMIKTTSKKENMEDVLIILVYFNMCGGDRTYKFTMQLQECRSWSQKMDLLYRHLPEAIKCAYSSDYLYDVMCGMANRLKSVININFESEIVKLKSPVMLVRPKQASFTDIPHDYDLSKYTEHPVEVRYVQGNHLTMLDGNEIIEIIDDFAPLDQ